MGLKIQTTIKWEDFVPDFSAKVADSVMREIAGKQAQDVQRMIRTKEDFTGAPLQDLSIHTLLEKDKHMDDPLQYTGKFVRSVTTKKQKNGQYVVYAKGSRPSTRYKGKNKGIRNVKKAKGKTISNDNLMDIHANRGAGTSRIVRDVMGVSARMIAYTDRRIAQFIKTQIQKYISSGKSAPKKLTY